MGRGMVAKLEERWVAKLAKGWVAKLIARLLGTASSQGSNPDIPQKS